VIDPRGIPFLRWAATITEDYADYAAPILRDPTAWKMWAAMIVDIPVLTDIEALPDPRFYETAERWAQDLYAVVEG
jgi:hypothetical protein